MKLNNILRFECIVDKVFRELSEDSFTAVVNEKLKLKSMLPRNADSVKKLADNRFFVSGGFESDYITDKYGNIIAQLDTGIHIVHVSDGLAVINKTESRSTKYGIIDKDGNTLVPMEYDFISNYYGDYALGRLTSSSNSIYRIDRQGNAEILPPNTSFNSEGYYHYYDNERNVYMLFNYAGTKLLEGARGFYAYIYSDERLLFRTGNIGRYEYYIVT